MNHKHQHQKKGIGNINTYFGRLSVITAFRALRLFRIFKLIRTWLALRTLMLTIMKTIVDIAHFTLLVLLFMIITSLLGMEFFAYRVYSEELRMIFGTFGEAMITIFALLVGNKWNEITYIYLYVTESW